MSTSIDLAKKLLEENEYIVTKNSKGGKYPEPGTGYWYVYWYVNTDNYIENTYWGSHEGDLIRFHTGNFFLTEEAAKKKQSQNQACVDIKKYCFDNGIETKERNTCGIGYINKGYVGFATTAIQDCDRLDVLSIFYTFSDAQKVIDNCLDNLKILFDVK